MIDYKKVDTEYADALFLLKSEGSLLCNRLRDEFEYSEIVIQRLRQNPDIRFSRGKVEIITNKVKKPLTFIVTKKPQINIKEKNNTNDNEEVSTSLKLALNDVKYRLKFCNKLSVDQVKALYPQSPDALVDALKKSGYANFYKGYFYKLILP